MERRPQSFVEIVVQRAELWRVNRYLWLSIVFAGVWLWLVGRHYNRATQADLAFVFILSVLNLSFRSWLALHSARGTTGQLGWAFTTIDIFLIAAAIHLTGRMDSDLWLFYFLVVVTETLSVSVKAELLLQVIVVIGFTVAVWPIDNPLSYFARVFALIVTSGIARRLYGNAQARSAAFSRMHEQLTVEREKTRVAREIHDGVGREIVNATLSLEIALRAAETAPQEVPEILTETLATLRAAMEDTRSLIFETRSYTEWDGPAAGLSGRLEHYARRFAQRTGLAVDCQCRLGEDVALSEVTVFGILRVMQESLNNIAKHAHARSVRIELSRENDRISLVVSDDGDGFDLSVASDMAGGIGLPTMRERAEELGGVLTVASSPGQGATISLSIPNG